MQVKQWEDKNLAQFSYSVLSANEKKIVLIDPFRNPQPFLEYAAANKAEIIAIIETHPHADFVSSHLEISKLTGAPIYIHSCAGVAYPSTTFDDGDFIKFGEIKLTALHTPGHSPDSISVLLERDGKQHAVFTGDTLFIGDCGRPDLREGAGNLRGTRQELAKNMYHSLRNKLMTLADSVVVYPGHGAGSLCGKNLGDAKLSTIGSEKQNNWALQAMTEAKFVENLLSDQPFVPAYFPFNVELNRVGADAFYESISAVPGVESINNESEAKALDKGIWVVDTRPQLAFKKGHLQHSVNLVEGDKFETWLGTIITPGELFYLAGENEEQLKRLIERIAAIGYEPQVKKVFVINYAEEAQQLIDLEKFKANKDDYTIIDVRNPSEVKKGKVFKNSLSIPLADLQNRISGIPTDKPVVVHCEVGYRSAAASSIIHAFLKNKTEVFDLSDAIKQFQ